MCSVWRTTLIVNCDLDLWPQTNRFPKLIVDHLCVKFGDRSCIGIFDIIRINKHTNAAEQHTYTTAISMANYAMLG